MTTLQGTGNNRVQLLILRAKDLSKFLQPRFLHYVYHIIKRFFRYFWVSNFGNEATSMEFRNIEGNEKYYFSLPNRAKQVGVAAFIRAKNEEDKILLSLGSIYDVFDQVIVVDNGSTDKTAELVRQFKAKHDQQNKITLVAYPFTLSRWGPEYAATPDNSLSSMVYFSNYAMSHSRFSWVFKWDADMLLRREEKTRFKKFLHRIQNGRYVRWAFVGQNLYQARDGKYYSSDRDLDRETRLYPFNYHNRFFKTADTFFEVFWSPLPRRLYNNVLFYELKFSDTDEFVNWSREYVRTERGQREMKNLELLKQGHSPGTGYQVHDEQYVQRNMDYS